MNQIFLFLALILLSAPLIWKSSKFWQGKMMMLVTVLVFAWIAPFSLMLMLLVALLQWLTWHFIFDRYKKAGFLITILLPLLPLIAYKLGHETRQWILPLGLSYYAFRQIHVAFEYYKGELKKPSLEEYFHYLLFLPVILVGPIHRMPEFQRSFRRMKWQSAMFSDGLERMLYGLVKISFLGNYLFSVKLQQLAQHFDSVAARIYIETVAFTCNAYVQFAGFSDLAIGMGLIWGIRVMENFNRPFLATNMQEFWQRWHISLSSWCRDYVFQPLIAFSRNRWVALIVSMLVLALWHEISMRYVLWGMVQAILVLITVQSRKSLPAFSEFINHHSLGKWLGRIWVFHLFAFSCILIGSENIHSLSPAFRKIIEHV
jgi:alginate O-acetyltransferase complex protein AlgI